LLGVEQKELLAPKEATIGYIKEDLPFAQPLAQVNMPALTVQNPGAKKPIAGKDNNGSLPVFGAISRMVESAGKSATSEQYRFADGAPAVISHPVENGRILYCAFLPGLSYFKPAIPKRPVDRGGMPDSMAHFLPTQFDARIGKLIGDFAPAELRPLTLNRPLVEASIIESKAGTAIALTNWTTTPIKNLQLTANIPLPTRAVSLSTGKPVTMTTVNGKTVFTLDLEVADTLILR